MTTTPKTIVQLCRLSLRERTRNNQRYFRGAKGDNRTAIKRTHLTQNEMDTVFMSDDFWNKFSANTNALEAAIKGENWPKMSEIVDELSECLHAIEPKLNLSVSGPKPFRLSILSLPGADEVADKFVATAKAPKKWNVSASLPEFDPLEAMSAEDAHGEKLNVKYEELDGKVLPPVDGRVTIVFSIDAEFDPAGERGHLYKAIAENVVFTVLGGWPPELEKAMLLPRSVTGQQFPLEQLRQQWMDVCGSD